MSFTGQARKLRAGGGAAENRAGKLEPGGVAAGAEIDAFRIDARHHPILPVATEKASGIVVHRVSVIRVHMREDVAFGDEDVIGFVRREQEIMRRQPVNAPEAANEMATRRLDTIETEILEIRIARRRRVVCQIAGAVAGMVRLAGTTEERETRSGKRFLQPHGAVEEEGNARVRRDVPAVVGEVGKKEKGRPIRGTGGQHERGVGPGLAILAEPGGEGCAMRAADQAARQASRSLFRILLLLEHVAEDRLLRIRRQLGLRGNIAGSLGGARAPACEGGHALKRTQYSRRAWTARNA